jgi:hypothetical protein
MTVGLAKAQAAKAIAAAARHDGYAAELRARAAVWRQRAEDLRAASRTTKPAND